MAENVPPEGETDGGEPTAAIPSPEDTLRRAIRRLPREAAGFLLTAISLISWITLPINFLSQLVQIPVVLDLLEHLYEQLLALQPLLDAIVSAVRPTLIWWAHLIQPLKEFIGALLPDWVPVWVEHVLLVFTLVAPAFLQRMLVRRTRQSILIEIHNHGYQLCYDAAGIRELRERATISDEINTLHRVLMKNTDALTDASQRRMAVTAMSPWLAAIRADKNYVGYPESDDGKVAERRMVRIEELLGRIRFVQFTYNAAGALIVLATVLTIILVGFMLVDPTY